MNIHQKYMQRCIELAAEAKENGHTAVGSILVTNDAILAEGKEGDPLLPDPMSHAENIAILKAIQIRDHKNLSDCTLYTTVEPCFMCAYLIRQTKIQKVIFGTTTPAGGYSSDYPILLAKSISSWGRPPEVLGGFLRESCENIMK